MPHLLPVNYAEIVRKTGLRYIAENPDGFSILTDSAEVDICLRNIMHRLSQPQSTAEQVYSIQLSLVQLLLEIAKCASYMNEGKLSYIKKALNYIRKNFHVKITADEIAAFVGLHKVYLSQQFKKYTDRTLFATINLFRLSKCAQLLRDTSLPVTQIASRVGFSTPAQMNYEFNRHFNASPTAYRKAYLTCEIDHAYLDYSSFAIRVNDEDFLLNDETFYRIPQKHAESFPHK